MKKWYSCVLCMTISFFCNAQKLDIEGFYKSRDFYILNPQTPDSGYCAEKIYVNGVKTPFEKAAVIVIRLDTLGLKSGDPVKIEIYHKIDCRPRIITEMDYPKKRSFDVTSVSIDEKGILQLSTKNETEKLPYIVEQFLWNKWVAVAQIEGKGEAGKNEYSQALSFHNGTNKFRIKQVSSLGQITLSSAVEFKSGNPKIILLNERGKIQKEINFSAETRFEIYDSNGSVIKKGIAKTIDCSSFPKGAYFLNFDNQMTELTKMP